MWAIASAYLFQDLHCACHKCYGPNIVLLHSGVQVLLYYLPVWGFNECFCNVSHCISFHLQVAHTHKRPSVQHAYLQESVCCKYKMHRVSMTKSMDAVTARDHWSQCRHCMRFQLPLPVSLIAFCSECSQWICNDRAGVWIKDESSWFSRPLQGVGVQAMPDEGINTTQPIESVCDDPLGAGALWLLPPGERVGLYIECHRVADGVDITGWLICATQKLSSKDKGVEFWP